jgi:hypothetical protein
MLIWPMAHQPVSLQATIRDSIVAAMSHGRTELRALGQRE